MPSPQELARIRNEYLQSALSEEQAGGEPLTLFERWLKEAIEAQVAEPTAFTLATADGEGRPAARILLLKGFDAQGFVFYTNYESRKGRELDANAAACLNFSWLELQRQVRIDGIAERVSREESREYFLTRPFGSQVGALASSQSAPVADRETLDREFQEAYARYEGGPVPLPENWGGYRVVPRAIEFWQGRLNRLHDRFLFSRREPDLDANDPKSWRRDRLAP